MNECRYKLLAEALIEQATAPECSPFMRRQIMGELGGLISLLSDRGDWLLGEWEQAANELAALKEQAAKVTA